MKNTSYFYKTLPLLIGVLFLVFACHKEKPVVLPADYIAGSSCTNGVKDANEDGIDCGGVCDPCSLSYAGCSFYSANNKISISGNNSSVTFTKCKSFVSNGKYTVLSTNNSGDTLKFTFGIEDVEFFRRYNPSAKTSLSVEKVFIEAKLNSLPYPLNYNTYYEYESIAYSEAYYDEGYVHLNKEDGKFTVSFCELELKEKSQGGMITFKGKIVEK